MDYFTTQHICSLFKVSHQTVKTWAREFAAYLSPTATPQDGKKRLFVIDDIRVFALIADYRSRGYVYDDAHLALRSGQRGDVPATAGAIEPTAPPSAIVALKEELVSLRQQLTQAISERDETRGQNKLLRELLKEQVADAQQRITELIEANARLKAGRDK